MRPLIDTNIVSELLIAATALLHRIPLATRNIGDFLDCSIDVVNPFSG